MLGKCTLPIAFSLFIQLATAVDFFWTAAMRSSVCDMNLHVAFMNRHEFIPAKIAFWDLFDVRNESKSQCILSSFMFHTSFS